MPSNTLNSPGVRMVDAGDIQLATADKLSTALNQAGGTMPANAITGGSFVVVINNNAAPGTITTRTAAQMYADDGTASTTDGYTLRICNNGAGTLTLGAGTGVTLTGTMTVATATFRDFNVQYGGSVAAGITVTITNIGTGTYS